MASDEELEQMLDSGQSEVFVSNVSGHSFASPFWDSRLLRGLAPSGCGNTEAWRGMS